MARSANAAEIHAIVTGALTGAFRELVPQFERQSGDKVIIAWGPSSGTSSDAIPVRIQNGEPVDVLIMLGPALDALIKQAKFTPVMRVDVAQSGVGVGVRSGTSKPDISSTEALRRTLLEAKSIGYSEGGSGVYVSKELLRRLGIADQVADKLRKITGELVGEAIARGEVEIGIQQISELRVVPGVEYAGPLPNGLQNTSVIAAAVSKDAKEPDAARTFVAFISSPAASSAFTNSGLDVPPR
jgi:molybdate transport system substrate-binding protein